MPKVSKITELFDEHNEVAAWIVLFTNVGLLLTEKLDQWPFVVGVGLSLVTLLGSKYFSGIKVSAEGLEISDREDDA